MVREVSHAVARFVSVVNADPGLASRFAAGATEQQIKGLSEALALDLPEELLAFLSHFDGNAEPRWNDDSQEYEGEEETLFADSTLRLLSVDGILREKSAWDDLASGYEAMDDEEREENRHRAFWNRAWVPFLTSEAEVFAIATEPCFAGPAGQVVWFDYKGHDCWEVRHESFSDWLRTVSAMLERDASAFDEAVQRENNPRWRFIELDTSEPERFERYGSLMA
jgi:cell wall assembly regulator SMI1